MNTLLLALVGQYDIAEEDGNLLEVEQRGILRVYLDVAVQDEGFRPFSVERALDTLERRELVVHRRGGVHDERVLLTERGREYAARL